MPSVRILGHEGQSTPVVLRSLPVMADGAIVRTKPEPGLPSPWIQTYGSLTIGERLLFVAKGIHHTSHSLARPRVQGILGEKTQVGAPGFVQTPLREKGVGVPQQDRKRRLVGGEHRGLR